MKQMRITYLNLFSIGYEIKKLREKKLREEDGACLDFIRHPHGFTPLASCASASHAAFVPLIFLSTQYSCYPVCATTKLNRQMYKHK